MRREVRKIFQSLSCVYPVSKIFMYIMGGLASKNSKQRAGEFDVIYVPVLRVKFCSFVNISTSSAYCSILLLFLWTRGANDDDWQQTYLFFLAVIFYQRHV